MTAAEWTPASCMSALSLWGVIRLGRGGRGCGVWEVEETEAMMSDIFKKNLILF